jgi:hypothetical protein
MALEKTQEVDVWWGAYAGRTMVPSFVLCGLVTAAVLGGGAYLALAYDPPPLHLRYIAYALLAALWLVQLLRCGYRTISITYRLTTHRLLRDHGFIRPAAGEVLLACITAVRVKRSPLERLLGVGRVIVVSEEKAGRLVLHGVHRPERIALKIRRWVEHARQQGKSCQEARKDFPGILRAEHAELGGKELG